MAGELIQNPSNPGDPRPYQQGAAQGDAPGGGGRANQQKNFLVDTGAAISGISRANAANFQTTGVPGVGAAGANGGAMPVVTGITFVFQVRGADGRGHNVSCSRPCAITANVDIIGMDQLQEVHAAVHWDPTSRTGYLEQVRAHGHGGG